MDGMITRRHFLHVLIAVAAGGLGRLAWPWASLVSKHVTSDPLISKLGTFFIHKKSAVVVGHAYLQCVPEEANTQLLVRLICSANTDRRREFLVADLDKLRELLRLQQDQDFEHGRISKVKGWVLSETEVRLCALAALIQT